MNQGESPQISNLERHPTSREGITCVVCHRVENIRGGERERTVTIPYSTTSLPFLRPTRLSLILTGESTVDRDAGRRRWF